MIEMISNDDAIFDDKAEALQVTNKLSIASLNGGCIYSGLKCTMVSDAFSMHRHWKDVTDT
jgi:hypothetical protein